MSKLKYIGKTGWRRVNGRPLRNGELITDPNEVRDLAYLVDDFEPVDEAPKPRARRAKKEEK